MQCSSASITRRLCNGAIGFGHFANSDEKFTICHINWPICSIYSVVLRFALCHSQEIDDFFLSSRLRFSVSCGYPARCPPNGKRVIESKSNAQRTSHLAVIDEDGERGKCGQLNECACRVVGRQGRNSRRTDRNSVAALDTLIMAHTRTNCMHA